MMIAKPGPSKLLARLTRNGKNAVKSKAGQGVNVGESSGARNTAGMDVRCPKKDSWKMREL
jgi:hypothetical protein